MTLIDMLTSGLLSGDIKYTTRKGEKLQEHVDGTFSLYERDYTDEEINNAKVLRIRPDTNYRLRVTLDLD